MDAKNFFFVELQGLQQGKPFAGFAIGDFVDMFGREVKFEEDDYLTFQQNTQNAITAVKEKGLPGLPIDARKHDKGDAAGWITGVELGSVKNSKGESIPVLMLLAEWTRLGVELISEKIQTNFSPTVDLAKKVLRGGSLTNWPASVDGNGVPLFAAIELSEGVHALTAAPEKDKPKDEVIDMTADEIRELMRSEMQAMLAEQKEAAPATPQTIDLSGIVDGLAGNREEMVAEIKQVMLAQQEAIRLEAQREAQKEIANARREARIVELCQNVTNGSNDVPFGLPVDGSDLKEFLMRLQPADLEFAQKLLTNLQESGRVAFGGLGHGKKVKGVVAVPDYAHSSLRAALAAGTSPQEFFDAAGLGDATDYDLSVFIKEAK